MQKRIVNSSILYVMLMCTIFVFRCLGLDSPVKFLQFTMRSVEMKEKKIYKNEWSYTRPDERRQMCAYAKKEANLAYLDYNYELEWHNHHVHLVEVMYCPTLPTVYLFKEDYRDYLEITYLKSNIDDIKFNTEIIKEADSAIHKKVCYFSSKKFMDVDKDDSFTRLSLEDRRNLCNEARKFVTLVFLDNEVAEEQTYLFNYPDGQEEELCALACPTSPKLYIHQGNSDSEVKLILVWDSIDQFKFEVEDLKPLSVTPITRAVGLLSNINAQDRIKLCMLARDFLSLPVKDSDVSEAQWYSFQYPDDRKYTDMALLCPKFPKMYLRLVDLVQKNIKITFSQNPYDDLIYTVEMFDFMNVLSTEREEKSQTFLANHPFTALSADERWSLCHAAQNHLPHYIRLQMVPLQFIRPPIMREFTKWLSIDVYEDVDDVAIHCSASPAMYVRMQETQGNEMKAIMIALYDRNFETPRIHPKKIYDEEYGEDYNEYYGEEYDG